MEQFFTCFVPASGKEMHAWHTATGEYSACLNFWKTLADYYWWVGALLNFTLIRSGDTHTHTHTHAGTHALART